VNPLAATQDTNHRRICGRMHKGAHWQKVVMETYPCSGGAVAPPDFKQCGLSIGFSDR
jgi:hypothetical protein